MGKVFAETLASLGCNMLVVSNQQKELIEVADLLRDKYDVKVDYLVQDLTLDTAVSDIFAFCHSHELTIDILINNAGMFFFHQLDDEYDVRMEMMLKLHVVTPTRLCRLFGDEMRKRGFGYIINISSMAARLPFPGITVYSATKSYLRNFGEAYYYEMKDDGVGVTTVCPAAIATPLYRLNPKLLRLGVRLGVIATPQWLVKKALIGAFKRKCIVQPGFMNIWLPPFLSLIPRKIINSIWRKIR